LGKALQRGLTELGHDCTWAKTGTKGLDHASGQKFDAIVLDRMLPETDGLDVLRSIRRQGIRTPVLVLTALGGLDDRVGGLNAGADDYLVKPFEFPELVARLYAICRRSVNLNSATLTVGPLTLDLSSRRVSRDGRELELTPTEFGLLEFLMRNVGQVVTRKMLCEHLWESDWEGVTNVVEVHVSRLRNKVDRDFDVSLIHTIRGCGYVLRVPEE
jgi:two-component system OmpR family response regulator/two-component system copper resistance phosphate regulon response regulator CusR